MTRLSDMFNTSFFTLPSWPTLAAGRTCYKCKQPVTSRLNATATASPPQQASLAQWTTTGLGDHEKSVKQDLAIRRDERIGDKDYSLSSLNDEDTMANPGTTLRSLKRIRDYDNHNFIQKPLFWRNATLNRISPWRAVSSIRQSQ